MTTSHTPRRRFTKRTAALTAVGVALGTGAAYAAVIASLDLSGNIERGGDFGAVWAPITKGSSSPYAVTVSGARVGTAGGYEGGTGFTGPTKNLTLTPFSLMTGETATTSPKVMTTGGRPGYVSGFTGSPGAGWRVSVDPASCGVVVGTEQAEAQPVTLVIEATSAASPTALDLSKVKVDVTALPDGAENAPGSKVSGVTCSTAGAN